MNRSHFDQIIDNYAARFVELNIGDNNEVYKWEIAAEFRPMMNVALTADDTDFPAKLAAVVLLTKQTIDNGAELAFHALADYARNEPQAVRDALRRLLTPDGGDLEARTQRFTGFLNFCEFMRAKYYPDSWRYRAGMERNAGYEIKRLLLYDDNKGFALGENLRAPDPYVTWKVTEEQGRRSFDWGHYFTTERAAVKDFLKRAGDYEKENSVFLASEGPQPDSFKYYSTQRPIDIGTFPKGGGNDPIRFQNYDKRLPVEGGAFLAWGELEYGKQLTDDELFCYELRPSRDNPDVWRRMDALAQVVGPWEDMRQLPEGRRLTEWSAEADAYVPTAKATVEKLMECTENIRVRRALLTGDRQPSIRDQLKAAQREALEHQGPEAPKKKAPDRGER